MAIDSQSTAGTRASTPPGRGWRARALQCEKPRARVALNEMQD